MKIVSLCLAATISSLAVFAQTGSLSFIHVDQFGGLHEQSGDTC